MSGSVKQKRILLLAVLLSAVFLGEAVAADGDIRPSEGDAVRLAILEFKPLEEPAGHDYLAGVIGALLKQDLQGESDLYLLERNRLDAVMEEQRLQASGLIDDKQAVAVGELAGCDYLLTGGYAVIGDEILLDIELISVETAQVRSFSSRGSTEDIVHLAAEKIVRSLTGRSAFFRTADSAVPLLKGSLLPPATVKLFSPLVKARILIDGEFYGYTRGDGTEPILIELPPGEHVLETDLGRDFGVVEQPEIAFRNWRKAFSLRSGDELVLEDATVHFNSALYRIRKIVQDSHSFYGDERPEFRKEYPFSFLDRRGKAVTGRLSLWLTPEGEGVDAHVILLYQGDSREFHYSGSDGESREFRETEGLLDFKLELDARYTNRIKASWSLRRNDVHQGMHQLESRE